MAQRLALPHAAPGALVLAWAVAAGACAVGPDFRSPRTTVPAAFARATDPRSVEPVEPVEPAVLATWWRQFGDPVLDALVADALAANVDIAIARAQLREARALRVVAASRLGPQVSAGGSAARAFAGADEAGGDGAADDAVVTSDLFGLGFDASWEADLFGGLRRGVEAAEADAEASLERLRDARVSIVAEVVLNYVDLRTAEQQLAIAEATIATRADNFDLARWRMQAGLVSELDLAQARTDLESARATLPALRTSVALAQHRLEVLLRQAPGRLQARVGTTARVPLPRAHVAVGIPADTLRQRPDVRAAERTLHAETARLGAATAARYPSVVLSGSIGLEALTLAALGSPAAAVGSLVGAVTAPIFTSGRLVANVEIQDARLEQARLAYIGAVLGALAEVENALVDVANTTARRERLVGAAASARETLEIAQLRYSTGLADFLAVLDAQRTLLSLEEQLATSTGALASAQIQLYKALGGGWEPDGPPAPQPGPERPKAPTEPTATREAS